MEVVKTKSALRSARASLTGQTGFVPTMGALHAGHMALVEAARDRCAHVVASIFVNPTQFGNAADLEHYPQTLADDLDKLEAAGVDLVFVPNAAEMYPPDADTFVETPHLANILMGALRPGHFRGVATVVTKLFNLVRPDMAWFGAKDFQQVLVIKRMVADLEMGIDIIAHPTVREADGLAMSSRNLRLDPDDRHAAAILYQALQTAQATAAKGASANAIMDAARTVIAREPRASLQSLDLRDANSLQELPAEHALSAPAVCLLAAEFGPVLLIDNMVIDPSR
jgi:pantoate--beta-alanine ligase